LRSALRTEAERDELQDVRVEIDVLKVAESYGRAEARYERDHRDDED
jgi:hypothetical protein